MVRAMRTTSSGGQKEARLYVGLNSHAINIFRVGCDERWNEHSQFTADLRCLRSADFLRSMDICADRRQRKSAVNQYAKSHCLITRFGTAISGLLSRSTV